MFEIGNSLREARLRQQLGFVEAEQATKIRGKYLLALEDERFELLPAQTYVKGFLRAYAEFLGLDGQLYVDEYNSRYVTGEDEAPVRARRTVPRTHNRAHRRIETSAVLLALVGIAVVTALIIAAWKFGGSSAKTQIPNLGAQPKPAAAPVAQPKVQPAAPRLVHLVVTAGPGSSLLVVHAGSATGRLLFQGTLEPGRSQRFVARRLWIDAGAAENLHLVLNGRVLRIPAHTGPSIVTVTPRGLTAH